MRTRKTDSSPKPGPGKKATQAKKEAAAADKTPDTAPKSAPKSTPKSSATKASRARQSTPATAITTPEPKPDTEDAKEMDTTVEEPEKKGRGISKSPLAGKAVASSTPKLVETSENSPPQIKEDVKDGLKSCSTAISVDDQPEIDNPLDKNNEENKSTEVTKFDAKDAGEKLEVAKTGLEVKQENSDSVKKVKPETDPEVNDETEAHPIDNDDPEVIEDVNDNSDDNNEEDTFEDQDMVEETGQEVVFAEAGEGGDGGAVEGVGDEEGPKLEEEEQIQLSDMAKERKIKKEHEIFVGGLDRDAVEEDLKKAFEKVGEVVEVRLHKDYATNKNKGFAFVKFSKKEQVARALEEMKNPLIRGKRCGIAPSEDNDTLFLGNICNTWTKDAIKRKLKDYGIDTVESVTLVADTQNEGLSRGFAFLEFPCHADAMAAYKRLQKPDVIFGHTERTAKVAFGEPLREPDPEVMAQVKSVFIDGLPPYWDEDQVKERFKSYGEIERVVLARNMSTAKRKDFGFVNFANHEAAVACVDGVNDTELGDGKSKMKARARLANPLPKTQAVKGGMSGGFRIGHTGTGAYSRFGRGFGRGRFPSNRAGFQGGRGFHPRGRGGRGGRFPYATDDVEMSYPEFRGWRPYGVRGRRGSTPGRLGAFDRGRGRGFPSRRPPFAPEGGYSGRFGVPQASESHYYGRGRGLKRPFSMMEHDPSYLEPPSRLRPRYDLSDPLPSGSRYLDSSGSRLYSRDYYGPDYGDSSYSSYYGESSEGGYYY
ncbi:Polyadenylate-binding protein RBP47B [Platanthera zijinensis]|uniref:Polyadenylate-binding protein RBP47B n=1 Tax=Platanthera zijinensis TaxID=2320716 RepID=A0AAP0G3W0_9ASPA